MRINQPPTSSGGNFFRLLYVFVALLTGVFFLVGGAWLAKLNGSFYYVIAGIAYLCSAWLIFRRRNISLIVAWCILLLTLAWSLYEAGLNYWALFPRLIVPMVIFFLSMASIRCDSGQSSKAPSISLILSGLSIVVFFTASFFPHGSINNTVGQLKSDDALFNANNSSPSNNWSYFGRKSTGTRFAPYTDITPNNVTELSVAWTYHTGRQLSPKGNNVAGADENTPLQVDNVLYSCTPQNVVHAIDADSGKPIWKFDPSSEATEHVTCRSVGYYDAKTDKTLPKTSLTAITTANQCLQRILITSVDARMFALDAHTGELCKSFGTDGVVDLKKNMGDTENGVLYHPTASPVVMGHQVIVGGWSRDLSAKAISGVVRSFDILTGQQNWAWDAGRNVVGEGRPEAYESGTPNTWSVPAFDEDLNLVYLATGNGPPDYWGGNRSAVNDSYTDAIVAVDASTGATKWHFETVHHDLWDYDLGSQPVIFNKVNADGSIIPALYQTTKTGQVFVLDRRTGKPISRVEEIPVESMKASTGDRVSPTQPHSVDMPQFGTERLEESSMWGMTSFDQLYCRIKFRSVEYAGMFTPPSEKPILMWPGFFGGMNWGGVSVDERRGVMFINDIRFPIQLQLLSREEAKKHTLSPGETPGFFGKARPQDAGPYGAVKVDNFQSPLGVPCTTPPFGTLSAVDLKTQKLLWQVPMGTVKDTGPFGVKTRLPLPLGMPTLGGPTSTASGLVFYAGTQDNYLRALDSNTGKIIWKARLPVGATAAPLVYKSPKTGREYVAISAGGASHSDNLGDYIIAYALPEIKKN